MDICVPFYIFDEKNGACSAKTVSFSLLQQPLKH